MEVGKAGFGWMDRTKFTKVGGKWKGKKVQCDETAEGDGGVGEGEGRSGRDLQLTHTI